MRRLSEVAVTGARPSPRFQPPRVILDPPRDSAVVLVDLPGLGRVPFPRWLLAVLREHYADDPRVADFLSRAVDL